MAVTKENGYINMDSVNAIRLMTVSILQDRQVCKTSMETSRHVNTYLIWINFAVFRCGFS